MTRRDLIYAAAYSAAFSDAMRRGCHGQMRRVARDGSIVEEPIDARAEAAAWARLVAEAAAESAEGSGPT